MNCQTACNQGFSIKKNLSFIPGCTNDDQGKLVSLPRVARETDIHRTTILARIKSGELEGLKIKYRWHLRLRSYQKLVETYRYRKLRTRTGSWWTEKEKALLSSDLSIGEIAEKIDRSYDAVKVKRSKMRQEKKPA